MSQAPGMTSPAPQHEEQKVQVSTSTPPSGEPVTLNMVSPSFYNPAFELERVDPSEIDYWRCVFKRTMAPRRRVGPSAAMALMEDMCPKWTPCSEDCDIPREYPHFCKQRDPLTGQWYWVGPAEWWDSYFCAYPPDFSPVLPWCDPLLDPLTFDDLPHLIRLSFFAKFGYRAVPVVAQVDDSSGVGVGPEDTEDPVGVETAFGPEENVLMLPALGTPPGGGQPAWMNNLAHPSDSSRESFEDTGPN